MPSIAFRINGIKPAYFRNPVNPQDLSRSEFKKLHDDLPFSLPFSFIMMDLWAVLPEQYCLTALSLKSTCLLL